MKGIKLQWSKHVDQGEFWMRHGFRIGYNFLLEVDSSEREEFDEFLQTISSARVLHVVKSSSRTYQLFVSVPDDNEAVQFKMSIL
jgi:hypothetical protein